MTLALTCALGVGTLGRSATAEELTSPTHRSPAPRKPGSEAARGDQPELEMSLEFASAYVFRGYNVFQAENQREQKWVQHPLVVWTAPGTGLSVGYAGANQLTGDNLVSNVADGLGAEQDLFAGYSFARNSPLGLGTELIAVAYPVADKRAAGTDTPFFVAASIEPRYRHRAFLYVGYLHGFRHGPLDRDQVYVSPRVEKRLGFGERFELALLLGAGMKILALDRVVRSNMFDVLATATLTYAVNDVFYVGSKVGWAWTNLTPSKDPDTGASINPRFADEYVPFWALIVGAEFASGPSASPRQTERGARAR